MPFGLLSFWLDNVNWTNVTWSNEIRTCAILNYVIRTVSLKRCLLHWKPSDLTLLGRFTWSNEIRTCAILNYAIRTVSLKRCLLHWKPSDLTLLERLSWRGEHFEEKSLKRSQVCEIPHPLTSFGLWTSLHLLSLKNWAFPGIFSIFPVSLIQLIENKIAHDWIRTVDLRYRKRPFY